MGQLIFGCFKKKKVKLNIEDVEQETREIQQDDVLKIVQRFKDKYDKIDSVQNNVDKNLLSSGWQKHVNVEIADIVDQRIYPGCTKEICKARVYKEFYRNIYKCRKCNNGIGKPRFVSVIRIKDESGSVKAALFDDNCQKLFGCSASEMKKKSFDEALQIRRNAIRNAIRRGRIEMKLKVKRNQFNREKFELIVDSLGI